ncbi:methionyl-tRNA formyltransferase [Segnochrobactraceae bacterium EtOH-i3]
MSLRIVFMGTPDFSVPTLEAIVSAGHEVAAVYTRAPKPAFRGMAETPSPVEATARRLGLPVRTPKTLRDPLAIQEFATLEADAAVVIAYGLILPKPVLEAPPLGSWNLHASLLPRWRGAAPINRAIMAGDDRSGVMVMRMEEGLDTGPVALSAEVPILPGTTAGDLHDALAALSASLAVDALHALEKGPLATLPQLADGVTYAAKIDKAETRIDWTLDADAVRGHIHGLSPFPGAWCPLVRPNGKEERLKVLRAETVRDLSGPAGTVLDDRLTIACGAGAVRLVEVQRAGRSPMAAAEFLRGTALSPGSRLG